MPEPAPLVANTCFVHRLLRARDFQGRSEFDAVARWWREGHSGVCALAGIGGAGKTAILDHFLRVLPGGLESGLDTPKDPSLAAPGGILVFSFFDAPNPQVFFAQLVAWLKGVEYDPAAARPSFEQTRMALNAFPKSAGTVLLCLDGLEKVQDDGMRGGIFGQIQDLALEEFVSQIADGYFPSVCAIITTRFPIAFLEEVPPANYLEIAVDELSVDAAVQLLHQRGVKGDAATLERLANDCGRHALTVDLVGGYLTQYHSGNPDAPLDMPSEEEIAAAVQREKDPRRREFMRQSLRFSRVAGQYRDALAAGDPVALALLERICLFRLPVSVDQLAKIFLGPDRVGISGAALASLTPKELKDKLDGLSAMRLIEASPDGAYSIHPAVRDGFLKGFSADVAREGHAAVRGVLEAQLGTTPGDVVIYPPPQLDLLEEIVYHTLESGNISEAYHLFGGRMNGPLLAMLGNCQRVERLCRVLLGADDPASAKIPQGPSAEDAQETFVSWALALTGLGRLSAAVTAYQRASEIDGDADQVEIGRILCAETCVLRGRLAETLSLLDDLKSEDKTSLAIAGAFRAYARILRGGKPALLDDYQALQHELFAVEHPDPWAFALIHGDWVARSMAHYGRTAEARALCEKALAGTANKAGVCDHQADRKLYLALAEMAIAAGDLAGAADYRQKAMDWARQRDYKETLCGGALIAARIDLAAAKQDTPLHDVLIAGAMESLGEGLRIARSCGYGILHVDLLNARALAWLMQGKPDEAESDVRTALFDGIPARPDSGQPQLPAATAQEFGYAWGEAEGRMRWGEAFLLRAARSADRAELVVKAREQLAMCLDLQKRMEDPLAADTEKTIARVDGGWTTDYPRPQAALPAMTEKWKPMLPPVDFVIVTPLPEERDAVLRKLKYRKLPPSNEDIRIYYAADLPVKFPDETATEYKVIVVPLAGMGEKEAGNATNDAIRRWKPAFVLVVGIAGGLAKAGVCLGDVLIADQVADYELQKQTAQKDIIHWELFPTNKQLLLAAQNLKESEWLPRVEVTRPVEGKPAFKWGVMCTGNKTLANGLLEHYHKTWDWLVGVEMEAGGAASATSSQVRTPGFFMVRSASDLADEHKDTPDTKKWREYACDVAASFAIGLLESGPVVGLAGKD